jgi:hypothetical protein
VAVTVSYPGRTRNIGRVRSFLAFVRVHGVAIERGEDSVFGFPKGNAMRGLIGVESVDHPIVSAIVGVAVGVVWVSLAP